MAHVNESWQIYKFDACAYVLVAEAASELDVSSFLQNIICMQHLSYIHIVVLVHFETLLKFRVTAKRK